MHPLLDHSSAGKPGQGTLVTLLLASGVLALVLTITAWMLPTAALDADTAAPRQALPAEDPNMFDGVRLEVVNGA